MLLTAKGVPFENIKRMTSCKHQWAKFVKVVPFQNVKCVLFCIHQWANFDKVFPFKNIKCLQLWNGQGLPSVRTLTWHLVLNKPAVLFVQFHQSQPNSRVACMISPLYVATPWTYGHLLSFGGNEWFDVFMNILCSSHWNQAEHPCLHKYKKSD